MACEQDQKCGTCRFWGRETYFQSKHGEPEIETYRLFDTLGVCRRHAPSAGTGLSDDFLKNGIAIIQWPRTTILDWCGEWAEKESENSLRPNPYPDGVRLLIGDSMETGESAIEFRGERFTKHIRSTIGLARWAFGHMNKNHGIDLRSWQGDIVVSGNDSDAVFEVAVKLLADCDNASIHTIRLSKNKDQPQ